MGILDVAMNLASTQSDNIAKIIGKNPQEVKGAINQAQKILPEILNSKDGGISTLKRMGVDKRFMEDMYRKYGKFASKIPGFNTGSIGNTLNAIEKAMDKPNSNSAQPIPKKSTGFNVSKYPKV